MVGKCYICWACNGSKGKAKKGLPPTMKKVKYYYNTNTLRYEKVETPLRVKLLRVFGFLATSLVTAAAIAYFAFQFIGSPKERLLELQNKEMREDYY